MKEYMRRRIESEVEYMIETGATLREIAKVYGVGKSTVHTDLTERIGCVCDTDICQKIRGILDYHKEIRIYRAIEARKESIR